MSATPERLVEGLSRTHRHIAVLAAHDVLRDWTLSEDAAQLAFLLILNRLRSGDEALLDRPDAAVRRNARWAAMKIRAARLHSETAEDRYGRGTPSDDEGVWSSSEARFACEAILEPLPEHYREAIRLRFFRQLPDAAAASLLSVTLRAYRRRLDRALAMARSVAGDIGLRGTAAIMVALQRVRGVLRRIRGLGDLGFVWGTPVAQTTALAVIVLAPLGPALGAATHHLEAAPRTTSGAAAQPAAATIAQVASAGVIQQARPAQAPAPPVHVATPGAGALTETPADTTFSTAAAAPSSSGNGSAVAMGMGRTCVCQVMFESRDGWHTWRVAEAKGVPAFGSPIQLVLPPDYPNDPRIFLGSPSPGVTPDMVSQGFGAAFTALHVTGYLTASPTFEQDSTFLVAGPAGMTRFILGSDTPGPMLFSPPAAANTMLVAPALGSNVYFTTATDTNVMQVESSTAGGVSIVSPGVGDFYTCTGARCTGNSTPPVSTVYEIATSLQFPADHALAMSGAHGVALSRDSGKSYTVLPDTGGPVDWLSVSSTEGHVVVWALVLTPHGVSFMRWDGGTSWRTMPSPGFAPTYPATTYPLMLGADRVVIFRNGVGALCTADGGRTWAPVCPA